MPIQNKIQLMGVIKGVPVITKTDKLGNKKATFEISVTNNNTHDSEPTEENLVFKVTANNMWAHNIGNYFDSNAEVVIEGKLIITVAGEMKIELSDIKLLGK